MFDSEDCHGDEGDNDNTHIYNHSTSFDLQCNDFDRWGDVQVKKKSKSIMKQIFLHIIPGCSNIPISLIKFIVLKTNNIFKYMNFKL